jgi:hypothetical protein
MSFIPAMNMSFVKWSGRMIPRAGVLPISDIALQG